MAKARKASTRIILGEKELDAKLEHLKLSMANRIARKALGKGVRVALKAMKARVPAQYKEAKKALGAVVDRKGGAGRDQHRAKAGAAVGKAAKAKPKERKKGSGVGIGGANLHWFILGTKDRTRNKIGGAVKEGTSKSTGTMQPVMEDIVKGGFSSAAGEVQAVIRATVQAELEKEAKK